MNYCMLMAEIIAAPQLRYTQETQTPISEFTITFPGLRPDDPPQQMKVVGWGNLAQDIQSTYQVGDRVLIEGRLTMNTVDRPEGFKEKQAELTAQKIYRLTDLGNLAIPHPAVAATPVAPAPVAATPMSPSATAGTPPSPPSVTEPEVDYDDIPF